MARNSGSQYIFLLLFFQILPLMHCTGTGTGTPLAPALYVFGDSILDSGNNNFLPTLAKANFPPYGKDYARGLATGRFTNGRTVADFIAEFLGLPYSPPAWRLHRPSLTGLNYASGSCGILPETGSALGKCLSLGNQIDLFQRTIDSKEMANHFGHTSTNLLKYLSKSIFLFSVGSNDYLNLYGKKSMFSLNGPNAPQRIATSLLAKLSGHLERLHKLGARKMVLLEIGPIGCIPAISKTNYHLGKCLQESNLLATQFNQMLPKLLANLTSSLPGSIFVIGRIHSLGNDAFKNPSKYGFTDTSNSCCNTWANGTSACIPLEPPCTNAEQHMFWDGYHLTETAYSLIANACIYNGTTVCSPYNIQQLVQM